MLVLSACFAPLGYQSGDTTLSVNLGSEGTMARSGIVKENFLYKLSFSGPGGRTITENARWGQTVTIRVVPGRWLIEVEATLNGELYARGISTENVGTGRNNSVAIQMGFARIEAIGPFLAEAPGGTLENPVNLHLAMQLNNENWEGIFTALNDAGKYVNLYLSACTRSNSNTGGGLRSDGTLDDPYAILGTGRIYVVSLTLPEAADSIVDGHIISPFDHLSNLKHVSTGNGLKTIGKYAFAGDMGLMTITSVTFGNSVETIGEYAFSGSQLTTIMLPDSLITIGEWAFYGTLLTGHLVIPDSVITIKESAFYLNQLTSVTIGNGVVTIEYDAFSSFWGITSVTFKRSGVPFIDSGFMGNLISVYATHGAGIYTRPTVSDPTWTYIGLP